MRDCLCHEINIPATIPVAGSKVTFHSLICFALRELADVQLELVFSKKKKNNPGSAAPRPASFNSLLEAPLASFSMPARAPAERVSRILQLGLCHQWAPGPKPYEAECIFNTEEGISAVCFQQ